MNSDENIEQDVMNKDLFPTIMDQHDNEGSDCVPGTYNSKNSDHEDVLYSDEDYKID